MQRVIKSFPSIVWLVAVLFGAAVIAHAEPKPFDGGWEDRIEEGGTTYCIVAYTNVGEHVWLMPLGVTELAIDCLVVGGGGGGGGSWGGGGGAGGFIYKQGLIATGDLAVTVGAGGAGGSNKSRGKSGDPSSLIGSGIGETAMGGGAGGTFTSYNGLAGGSGGGTAGVGAAGFGSSTGIGGAGTEGQGNAGGNRTDATKTISGAGGGGAGEPGQDFAGYSSSTGGKGGDGLPCRITGEEVYYAGGGGGGTKSTEKYQRLGGAGGGGAGGWDKTAKPVGDDGTDGLGGGGGGGYGESAAAAVGGRGGSGVVIIRYAVPKVDPGSFLFVSGDPADYGEVSPAYGLTEGLKAGDERACSVVASWIDEAGTTRAICTGYTVYTNDAVYVEGTFEGEEPRSFTYVHPVCENEVLLVWHWQLQYKVDVAISGEGQAERSGDEWRLPGETGTVRATPADGYRFGCWMKGASSGHELEPELTFTVGEAPVALEVNFQKEVYVSKSGSDENAGTSWDDALATVTAALEKYATPYVTVDDGVYDITSGLQLTNSITVCGRNAEGAVIRLKEQPVAGDKTRCVFFLDHVAAHVHHIAAAGIWSRSKDNDTSLWCGRGICLYNGLVENCVISNNQTVSRTMNGGGAYVKGGVMRNCLIRSNKARSSASSPQHGGGVCLTGGLVENCTITGNYAENGTGSQGGGVYATGGTLRNCLVSGNYATTYSGGVYAKNATVENCTIVDNNHSTASTCYGLTAMDGAVVRNTIVRYNTSAGNELNISRSGTATFENCISDVASEGVTAADPGFVDVAGDDWHIGYGASFNTGTNKEWMVGATDLDGKARILNERVDIGCYEYELKGLACSFAVEADGALDESAVKLTASVGGAEPSELTFVWTVVNGAGVTNAQSGVGLDVLNLTLPTGCYNFFLTVSNATMSASSASADTLTVYAKEVYVSPEGSNTIPYGSFATGATNILDAIVFATDGTMVHLSDGIHRFGKVLTLVNAISIVHEGRRDNCILTGYTGSYLVQLNHADAVLSGVDLCGTYPVHRPNNTVPSTSMGYCLVLGSKGGTVTNCVVEGGHSLAHAGVSLSGGLLVDTIVRNNENHSSDSGSSYGGGVRMSGGTIDRCVITNNFATIGSGQGGGVYVDDGSVAGAIRNSLIGYNVATVDGGGIFANSGKVAIRNVLLVGNRARASGAIYCNYAPIESCTVVGNVTSGEGFAAVRMLKSATAVNCVFWDNEGGDLIAASTASVAYSCYPEAEEDEVNFNTAGDPMFRGGRNRGLGVISSKSTCFRSGMVLGWMADATDLRGNLRLTDGKVDRGCHQVGLDPGLLLMVR